MKSKILLPLLGCCVLGQAYATEYFVRPDGGTLSQCNGTVDKAYDEAIPDGLCAVKHIFELLDPQKKVAHIAGGDTINIANNADGSVAEYEMGRHGEYTSGGCHDGWAYGCTMPSIPSGTVANPTRIRGEGWDQGCSAPPSLWGSGRAKQLFTLDGSENVEMSCLEITDHSSCIKANGFPDASLVCDRSSPYDKPFADIGIYLADADNIKLTDIRVKGLTTGISAGRLGDVTLERVELFANSGAGWNGDILGEDNVTGTITFKDSAITFSGCGLIYQPGSDSHDQPHACAKQDLGGYGDGLGTGQTGGDWVFENTKIMYNNSDGIDLLYHELGGKITVKNSRIEGNGGNQLKLTGNAELVNNVIISNCGWNADQDAALGANGEHCRAAGTAVIVGWAAADDKSVLLNNTLISEGDCIISANDRLKMGIDNQSLYAVNNIFYGLIDETPGDAQNSCLYFHKEGLNFPNRQVHNNIIHQVKNFGDPCNAFNNNVPTGDNANEGLCTIVTNRDENNMPTYFNDADYSIASNPHFLRVDPNIRHTAYDIKTMELEANRPYPKDSQSPAYNLGYQGSVGGVAIPSTDFLGNPRGSLPDIGAVEYTVSPKAPLIISIVPKN
ncbi:hypothetical protein [Thalassomonas sp. RHCl1]|uniref:hypothetical protein n=1 Tax=Thalassomonas sp. RHCl1 TaxID=2995320 RepID=UPI00248A9DA7|nr:hypothetical protein [Thalassomonas sp. RHCl1]